MVAGVQRAGRAVHLVGCRLLRRGMGLLPGVRPALGEPRWTPPFRECWLCSCLFISYTRYCGRSDSDDRTGVGATRAVFRGAAAGDQAAGAIHGGGVRGWAYMAASRAASAGASGLSPHRGTRGAGAELDAVRRGAAGVLADGVCVRLPDPAPARDPAF